MTNTLIAILVLPFIIFLMRQVIFTAVIRSKIIHKKPELPKTDFNESNLPTVTVLCAAHNEELVISDLLHCLLKVDYPREKLNIFVVNDRSSDKTGHIVNSFASEYPLLIKVLHRKSTDTPGKPAAIQDALAQISSDILVVFDADYLPDSQIIRKLVAPFEDPDVGATMGRVVPYNYNINLLTHIIDIERKIGYSIDQSARQILGLMPQYGGTVGALRLKTLNKIGGMNPRALAEDTDITIRMYIDGWKIVYLDHAPCLEECPESWIVRFRQLQRWSMGHTQCLKYLFRVLQSKHLTKIQKFDAALLLSFYTLPILYLSIILINIVSFYTTHTYHNFVSVPLAMFFVISAIITLAQIALTTDGDKKYDSMLYIPFMSLSFLLGIYSVISGFGKIIKSKIFKKHALRWSKTDRFRK